MPLFSVCKDEVLLLTGKDIQTYAPTCCWQYYGHVTSVTTEPGSLQTGMNTQQAAKSCLAACFDYWKGLRCTIFVEAMACPELQGV